MFGFLGSALLGFHCTKNTGTRFVDHESRYHIAISISYWIINNVYFWTLCVNGNSVVCEVSKILQKRLLFYKKYLLR
jgi:hypothetical protein